MNNNQLNILAFQTIAEFMCELKNLIGKEYRQVLLFERFLVNVTISNLETIDRMSSLFSDFLSSNHDAVMETDHTRLTQSEIKYSDKIFVKFSEILNFLATDL